MVTVKKKKTGKQTYFYLEHSIREGNDVIKKEKYLGKKIPKNIEELKKQFLSEIYKEKWYPLLDKIKKNYSKEKKQTPKAAKEKNLQTFVVRFTYDTQRIEGSALSLRETANLLEKGVSPKEKPIEDVKEAEAHEKLFFEILKFKKDLSLQIVLYWHKKFLQNTKPKIAGQIRKYQVLISGSKFTPPFPAELNVLLRDFFRWYNKNKDTMHPLELAASVHLKFVTIHPFADGNGRISRLMMNFILHKHKYPMLDIHYENRTSYYNALERSQVKEQDSTFIQWFFRRYTKEYRRFL
ncbi:MAG: Fic family protein [Nanoarchaeota archaeon]|nr:Fic family protein [Nanoarchaeota archaeon]